MPAKKSTLQKSEYESLAAFRYTMRRFVRFAEEGAREVGLTPQQHQLLLAIKGQPGKEWANVSEIAEMLQIKHHAAVMLIDRCERAKWVIRTPSVKDRRQVEVSLLPEGEAVLAQLSERNLRELSNLRQMLQLDFLRDWEKEETE